MTVQTKFDYDHQYITNYSAEHQEPDWLLQLRLQGLEHSQTVGHPRLEKTKIESWNINQFKHQTKEEKVSSLAELPEDIQHIFGEEDQNLSVVIHKNGVPVHAQLSADLQQKGVIFTDFKTACREHSDLMSEHVMKLTAPDAHNVWAVHAALMNSGVLLYVPKNVEIELPVQSLFWQTEAGSGLIPHIIVIAEANSKVTYVEEIFNEGASPAVCNYVAEVYVGPGANVTFAAVDHLGAETTSYVYRHGTVEKDGHLEWALGQMHEGNTVSDNLTVLHGDGSTGDSKSVVVGKGSQSQNFVQKMRQFGLSTDGQILSHAVMQDAARAIFNGITKIEKGSTKSNGEQTERVLMMSEKARGDANPILLIDEDDVTAGHAASVGQVDADQLYYLMSRGISQEDAERLVILGFLQPVVEKIPVEGMKNRLVEVIERKIQ